jgi:hypothetical protein
MAKRQKDRRYNGQKTGQTIQWPKDRTDDTMAKRIRTDNTMAKRIRTDDTMAKRIRTVI